MTDATATGPASLPALVRFLPDGSPEQRGAIFGLDDVVTRTAWVHFAAWKRLFDAVLADWADVVPFDEDENRRYVGRLPRYDCVAGFLHSRGIDLPRGEPDDGIIAQFDGYDRLEELDWDGYRAKYGDIHRLDRILEAEGDSVNRYKASKQADVLMLFYLFSSAELRDLITGMGYDFDPQVIPRTVDYYLARTSHGSTLSRVVHSWVLARSDRARSWELLKGALESDISDIQGGTMAEGIHLGAMAGTVDLIQRGQTGLEFFDDTLALSPCLPQELQGLHLGLMHRGHWLRLDISCDEVRVAVPVGWPGPHRIRVRDEVHDLVAGEELRFPCQLHGGGWRPAPEPVSHDALAEQERLHPARSSEETRR